MNYIQGKFYVAEMKDDYFSPVNDRNYYKYEHLIVFVFENSYVVANSSFDSIPKEKAEIKMKVEFENLEGENV